MIVKFLNYSIPFLSKVGDNGGSIELHQQCDQHRHEVGPQMNKTGDDFSGILY